MSETYYGPVKARCDDGKTRTAMVKMYSYDGSYAADTFFSVPAYVKAFGKTVRGFVTNEDGEPQFVAYRYRKNCDVIKRNIQCQ